MAGHTRGTGADLRLRRRGGRHARTRIDVAGCRRDALPAAAAGRGQSRSRRPRSGGTPSTTRSPRRRSACAVGLRRGDHRRRPGAGRPRAPPHDAHRDRRPGASSTTATTRRPTRWWRRSTCWPSCRVVTWRSWARCWSWATTPRPRTARWAPAPRTRADRLIVVGAGRGRHRRGRPRGGHGRRRPWTSSPDREAALDLLLAIARADGHHPAQGVPRRCARRAGRAARAGGWRRRTSDQ